MKHRNSDPGEGHGVELLPLGAEQKEGGIGLKKMVRQIG